MRLVFESKYFRAGIDVGREKDELTLVNLGGDFELALADFLGEDADEAEYRGFGFGVPRRRST